ncbi:MAG: Gfo/Idh/MocA family oxidoreductase [Gemmataceae bacterium]|nr:Gfo/Idh/MocA family oxidoreductase [Gemmataceae bacterium]
MARQTRRSFLKHTLSAAATVTVAGTKSSGTVLGANDTVRVAVAGLNGRGESHVGEYARMKGVEVAYLVDPDTRTYKKRLDQLRKADRPEAACVRDVRKVLDDKTVDVVSIATPNHWHALMTVWGCQAGKDVYVEKPCSHNVHEGRIAVEVARKHNRVVQHGTQSRSGQDWANLAALAKSGQLGKLLVSRALCYKDGGAGWNTRGDIGHKPPKAPPAELDFDLWLGPAQAQPYHENLVHYRWHWFWDFGNGDIGNQGVHQMDIARWMIPGAAWPKTVLSLGGRFANNDQGQTPNAQVTVMDYGDALLIFEVRGLKSPKYRGADVGNMLHFEAGTVAGGKFYPKDSDQPAPLPKADGAEVKQGGIFDNFIACVRSRKADELHAPIAVGHVSAGLGHLANVSYRLGTDEPLAAASGKVAGNEFATETLARLADHLKDHGVKPEGTALKVGRKLAFDADAEQVRDDPQANALLTRKYRPPFVVPDRA